LCLDREHRLAYILGEVFGVTSEVGAEIAGITAAAFRKRLSRARERVRGFMARHCGLVTEAAPCRCPRRIDHAVAIGRVDPNHLLFAGRPAAAERGAAILVPVREMEHLHETAAIFRSHPRYAAPPGIVEGIRRALDTGATALLEET